MRRATFALLLLGSGQLCLAGSSSPITFASPEEASHALFSAVQKHDEPALRRILGAGAELLNSDDKAQDTLDREQFAQKYEQMHRLVREPAGFVILYVGAENWPFPLPLESRNGRWRFDSGGGASEIRFRRIGENEVTAIGICHAIVATQGHRGNDNEADGLIQTVLPDLERATQPMAFHGYYFRILSASAGRFAAVAYPAVYRSSGVMTFIINQDDVLREKDLGPNTARVAKALRTDPSDPTWSALE